MGLNKVFLEGNLTQNADLRYTQTGKPVATIRLATNETYWSQTEGKRKERTEYHTLVGWGKRYEALWNKECLNKGQGVGVIGRLQTRSWEDRQGNKRYTTEVVIGSMDEDFRLQPRSGRPQSDQPPLHGDSEEPPPVASEKDRPADKEVDDFSE